MAFRNRTELFTLSPSLLLSLLNFPRPPNGARAADTRGNEGRWEAEQLQPSWVVPLVGQMEEEDVSFCEQLLLLC